MALLKQSTAYTRMFKMIDSADHLSKKTGLTCTVNLSKAGAAFGAAGGTVTEVANGWYKIALSTTDTNTLGDLAYYITATGADDTDFVDQVYARTIDDLCFPTTSGRSLDVTATGEAGIDWANIGGPTTSVNLSGTTVATVTNGVTVSTISNNVITANSIAADAITAAKIADGAIDAATFAAGAINNAAIAAETGLDPARSNTAQAGAAGTITLDASASATTDFYVGMWIYLTGGTGAGQSRVCTAYNGTTKVATIAPNWATNPDATSTFAILPSGQITGVQGNVTGSVASVTGAVGSVTGNVGGNVTGSVGSVTGAVGSVTGNVGGNVVGSVASVTGAVGSVTGAVGSVTGAVGSVTGNVGGNVTGSVGSVATGGISSASFAAGAIDAAAIAADAIGASEIAADAIGSSELAATAANEIADAILNRNVSGGSSTGRLVKEALHVLRNKVSIGAGTMTVTDTDDTTTSWTAAVGTTAGNPISSIDPA